MADENKKKPNLPPKPSLPPKPTTSTNSDSNETSKPNPDLNKAPSKNGPPTPNINSKPTPTPTPKINQTSNSTPQTTSTNSNNSKPISKPPPTITPKSNITSNTPSNSNIKPNPPPTSLKPNLETTSSNTTTTSNTPSNSTTSKPFQKTNPPQKPDASQKPNPPPTSLKPSLETSTSPNTSNTSNTPLPKLKPTIASNSNDTIPTKINQTTTSNSQTKPSTINSNQKVQTNIKENGTENKVTQPKPLLPKSQPNPINNKSSEFPKKLSPQRSELPKEEPQKEIQKEVQKEIVKEPPKEFVKEIQKETPKETVKEIQKEPPKEIVKEIPKVEQPNIENLSDEELEIEIENLDEFPTEHISPQIEFEEKIDEFDMSFLDNACSEMDDLLNDLSLPQEKPPVQTQTQPQKPQTYIQSPSQEKPSIQIQTQNQPQNYETQNSPQTQTQIQTQTQTKNETQKPAGGWMNVLDDSDLFSSPDTPSKPVADEFDETSNDDIERLLSELDTKVTKNPSPPSSNSGSTKTPLNETSTPSTSSSISTSTSSSTSTSTSTPVLREVKNDPLDHERYTILLENLQADLEELGIDETELPEDKPIKFKHLSESVNVTKLKELSRAFEIKANIHVDKVDVNLYFGNACLVLKVVTGVNGTVILQQAIQKCGGVGSLDSFKLFLQAGEEKIPVTEKTDSFQIIIEHGAENCKFILEKNLRQKTMSLMIAVSKCDFYLKELEAHVAEGDMFYVLDSQGSDWRVKPISRNGKDITVPKENLEIDPEGWQKLQYKYGQKVYFDKGVPILGPKSSKFSQLKSFTSKMIKNVQNIQV